MSSLILSDNRFLDGIPVADYTAAGYAAANVRDGKPYTFWKSDRAGLQYLTVDCGSTKSADKLGLAGTNFHGATSMTVAVESSPTGLPGSWTSRMSAQAVPASTREREYIFTFATAGDRFWRVALQTATLVPSIGVLMLGVGIDFPRNPDAPYAPVGIEPEVSSVRSKVGHLIGVQPRFRTSRFNPSWTDIETAFVEGVLYPWYRDYGADRLPFFWNWDFAGKQQEVYLVRIADGFRWNPGKSNSVYYDRLPLELEGIIR